MKVFFDLACNLLLGHFNFNTLFHWLQELLDAEFIPIPDDSQDCIDPLTKPYTESATLPYEELDQLKDAGKSLMVLRLHSGGGVSSWVGGPPSWPVWCVCFAASGMRGLRADERCGDGTLRAELLRREHRAGKRTRHTSDTRLNNTLL